MKALKVKRTDKRRENNLEESLSESDALIENLLICNYVMHNKGKMGCHSRGGY